LIERDEFIHLINTLTKKMKKAVRKETIKKSNIKLHFSNMDEDGLF
jgi:hypothetical protein